MQTFRIQASLAMAVASVITCSAWADGPHSVTANIGVVSNYIWRGQTQTNNQPAVQGGLDYAHESGFYAGTWVSNVDFSDDTNYELDLYGGFGGLIGEDLGYDLSVMYVAYPDTRDTDLAEAILSLSYKPLTLGVSYTIHGQYDSICVEADGRCPGIEGDLYVHAGLDFALPYNLSLGLRAGYYDYDNSVDYAHWGLSISRDAGDFGVVSFNYDQIGRETRDDWYDTDPKLWIGWKKEF